MFQEPAPDLQLDSESAEQTSSGAPPRSCDTGLFDDIPPVIWKVFLTGWGVTFGLFALFFATDRSAAFAIVISWFFLLMGLGLPIALAGQSKRGRKPTGIIQTHSGPLTTWEAGAQIASIPIAAVLALVCFILLAK